MNLEEFEKIVNICYSKRVEAITKQGKRIVTERSVTAEEIAHIVAEEFGFILIAEEDENVNNK